MVTSQTMPPPDCSPSVLVSASACQDQCPAVSVIIVNYNGGDYLRRAVESLRRQTFESFELIVFDNASTDGSLDQLDTAGFRSVRILRSPRNVGFASGNNRAVELARGQWIVLMNPDTEARQDWLEKLHQASLSNPASKSFASAQYSLSDGTLLDGAGDAYLVFGFPWRGGFGLPATLLPEAGRCFSACGAAAMYDRSVYLELGGFDERYFCYCEDVDLGYRFQLSGHDCLFVPDAVIWHAGSAISGHQSAFSTFYGTRNRVWTYFKNTPALLLLLTLPVHLVLTFYVLAHNAFTPRRQPMLEGLSAGFASAIRMRRSDRWRVPKRQVSQWTLIRSMAWNPWKMHARKPHVRPLPRS